MQQVTLIRKFLKVLLPGIKIHAIDIVGQSFCSIILKLSCMFHGIKKISNYVEVHKTGIWGVEEEEYKIYKLNKNCAGL